MSRTHVYIVGAGFSKYAGLPLQATFTQALLTPPTRKVYPLLPLIEHLRAFVHDAFDHRQSAAARFWPNLEDVFTNIDLAANTGHHLGPKHAPADLRTTRRVLLSRMMHMLHEHFRSAEKSEGDEWSILNKFIQELDIEHSSFISINWDTVIERRLAALKGVQHFDYRCGAIAARFPGKGNAVVGRNLPDEPKLPVVKIHGSVNWLYCDCCRKLYWFAADDAVQVALQLITRKEADRLKLIQASDCAKWHCLSCDSVPLTTRIATFSYLKALDFPMFQKSWFAAEALLRQADKWIFIGYSLPAADYEFKHLLKRVQLSRTEAPEFVVITGGTKEETSNSYHNYQRFFGRRIRKEVNFFDEGLTKAAIRAAHK